MLQIIFMECLPVGGQRVGEHRDPNAISAQRAARYLFLFQTHCKVKRCGKLVKFQ